MVKYSILIKAAQVLIAAEALHSIYNCRPDELACIPEAYQPIVMLIRNLLNWLYARVEELEFLQLHCINFNL